MAQKSSKVARVKCVQHNRGRYEAYFIFSFLLSDGKSFIYEATSFNEDINKDLFLVEVGDTIVYEDDKIVEIKFVIK